MSYSSPLIKGGVRSVGRKNKRRRKKKKKRRKRRKRRRRRRKGVVVSFPFRFFSSLYLLGGPEFSAVATAILYLEKKRKKRF